MRPSRWSLQDAKNSFSVVVSAAVKGVPQTVTRRGEPAVVVISVAEYERLNRRALAPVPSFVDHLLAFPQHDQVFERAAVQPRDVVF